MQSFEVQRLFYNLAASGLAIPYTGTTQSKTDGSHRQDESYPNQPEE